MHYAKILHMSYGFLEVATARIGVIRKTAGWASAPEILSARHRAAFAILTDDRDHGIAL